MFFLIRLALVIHCILETQCILFSSERRNDAISAARALRAQGKSVALQDINSVTNVDAYTASFAEVQFFVGNGGSKK